MKSIVTGGCGFIGSHIVDRLVQLGHEVVVIDNKSSHSKEEYYYNDNASYYEYNLCDYDLIEPLFKDANNVFHLAAEVSIQYCVEYPSQSMKNNVVSTLNVLEASRINNVNKFIFSSTCAVYGNKFFLPSVETNPVECLNTYSISKHTGEELCQMYYNLYGLKTVIFRYFNVYGDRQPTSGQYVPVMGIFIRQKNNKQPLTIVGEGYQTRDFVNVKDVANANILASQVDIPNYGEIFNVGTGVSSSIEDIANLISDNQIHLPPREGEVMHSRADNRKIKQTFGWDYTTNLTDWIKKELDKNG
jgi:UDP-glucose 4-epimerase